MKGHTVMKKIVSVITSVAAAAALSLTASAYTIDTDLGFGWSANTTIPGSEFENVTTDTTITITYETNPALAAMPGQEYWCIKTMINDEGWPFVDTLVGPTLSEGKDSYSLDVESSSISFKIPAEELEHIQVAGMALMGHGIKLLEMTTSDDAPATTPDNSSTATPPATQNPNSGVEGVAAIAGTAALALGAMIVTKKRSK